MRTWIEIDGSSLEHNASLIKNIASSSKLNCIVKANAYGHGAESVVDFLVSRNLCDMISVAHYDELHAISKFSHKVPILLLGHVLEEYVSFLIDYKIECTIFSLFSAQSLLKSLSFYKKVLTVHLKVDTGMHRLGFVSLEEFESVCLLLSKNSFISVKGLYSHCFDPAAYDMHNTEKQQVLFLHFLTIAKKYFPFIESHLYASGTYVLQPHYSMIRCGSALYGFWKSDNQKKRFLEKHPHCFYKECMKWKTRIIQVKTIQAGEYVGYNCFVKVEKETVVAVIPVGYSDGYRRELSGKGVVVVKGLYAPLIGYVTMNFIMIDVTNISDVFEGDEVLLVAPFHEYEYISLSHQAHIVGQPAICLASTLSPLIPRKVVL